MLSPRFGLGQRLQLGKALLHLRRAGRVNGGKVLCHLASGRGRGDTASVSEGAQGIPWGAARAPAWPVFTFWKNAPDGTAGAMPAW